MQKKVNSIAHTSRFLVIFQEMKSIILILLISSIHCFGQQSKKDSIEFQKYWTFIKSNLEKDIDSCVRITKKMLLLSQEREKSTYWIKSYISIGLVEKIKNNVFASKQAYRNAMHISDTTNNHILYGNAVYCLGTLLSDEGKLDSVAIITYKALDKLLLSNKKNTSIELRLNYRVAELEIRLKNYDKAIKIYKSHLTDEYSKRNGYLYGCLGAIYHQKKEYQNAITANLQSLNAYRKDSLGKENHNIAIIHLNLGETYLDNNQTDLAEVNFKKALKILTKNHIDIGLGSAYFHLSRIENLKNSTQKEKKLLKKAVSLSKNNIEILESAHFNLAIAYAKSNDIGNKNKHLDLYNKIKDSTFSLTRAKTIDELNAKYNNSKNKLEIKRLEEINTNERRTKIIFLVFLITISLLLVVITFLYKQRNRSLKILHENQIKLKNEELQNTITVLKNETIQTEITNINKERERISRDLHESISGNLAAIKLKLISYDNVNLKNIIANIDDTYHEVRAISHNLKPSKFLNNSFNLLIEQLCVSPNLKIKSNVFFYPKKEINDIREIIKIEVYKIIQEIINNIHKHAKATTIEVSLTLHQNYLNIIIEDNGIGFSSSKTTNGIGLANIRARIKELNGEIIIDSKINYHTIINIKIPDAKK